MRARVPHWQLRMAVVVFEQLLGSCGPLLLLCTLSIRCELPDFQLHWGRPSRREGCENRGASCGGVRTVAQLCWCVRDSGAQQHRHGSLGQRRVVTCCASRWRCSGDSAAAMPCKNGEGGAAASSCATRPEGADRERGASVGAAERCGARPRARHSSSCTLPGQRRRGSPHVGNLHGHRNDNFMPILQPAPPDPGPQTGSATCKPTCCSKPSMGS